MERAKGFEPSTPTLASGRSGRLINVLRCTGIHRIALSYGRKKGSYICTRLNPSERLFTVKEAADSNRAITPRPGKRHFRVPAGLDFEWLGQYATTTLFPMWKPCPSRSQVRP